MHPLDGPQFFVQLFHDIQGSLKGGCIRQLGADHGVPLIFFREKSGGQGDKAVVGGTDQAQKEDHHKEGQPHGPAHPPGIGRPALVKGPIKGPEKEIPAFGSWSKQERTEGRAHGQCIDGAEKG